MYSFKQFINEQQGKEAFFTFGRMNPPTVGHGKLVVGACFRKAGRNPFFVYLSHSQDPKKESSDIRSEKSTHVQ